MSGKASAPLTRRWLPWVIAVAAMGAAGALWLGRGPQEEVLRLTVSSGDFEETVRAMGVIEAAKFEKVRAPIAPYERQITWLIDEGTRVAKGDLIAQFDVADVERNYEKQSDWVQNIEHRQADAKADWSVQLYEENIKREKETQRNEFAQLKYKRTQLEPPLPKEIGVTEKDKQERLTDDATRRVKQIERQRNVDVSRREWWLKYRRGRTQEVKDMVQQYEVRAPIDSIVVYPLIPVNGLMKKVELGDYLGRDQPFAQLPDLRSLILKLGVAEYRVQKLTEGMPVRFRCRAFPQGEFTGRVISVSRMASNDLFNDGRRLFEVIVAIDKVTETGLKVGMVAEASLVVAKHPAVYAIPRDYIAEDAKGLWLELESEGGRREKRSLDRLRQTDDFVLLPKKEGDSGAITVLYRTGDHPGGVLSERR